MVINLAADANEAMEVFRKISKAIERFLGSLSIDYLGFIPSDERLPLAVKQQRAVLEIYPKAPSSRSLTELAKTISERPVERRVNGSVQFFWKQLLQSHQQLERNGGID